MPPKGSRKKRTRQTKVVTNNAGGNEEAAPVVLKNDSTSKVATRVTLTGLPFDLLSEIYALLHPVDLLQLARTSKVFRKVLMNRQASRKMIWLPALASVRGLPPCPKDLAEPRYINLLLESTCDGCSVTASRSSINTRVWKHLTNYSQTCGGPGDCDFPNFVDPHELPDDLPEDFETMVPASCYTFRRSLSRPELVSWRLADKNGDEVLLYDLDAVKALKEEYDLTKKGKARELWIERKKEEMRTKFQFFKACRDFLQTQIEEEREAEHKRMEALKDKRSEQIFKKLSEIGYAEECRTFFELNPKEYMAPEHVREYRRKLVPKELTDEEWPVIKDSMVAFMKTAREHNSRNFKAKAVLARMDNLLKPAYAKYVFSKPPNTVVLTTAEISMMPEWREVLCTKPLDKELTSEDTAKAVAAMDAFVTSTIAIRTEALLDLVRKSKAYEGKEVTTDTLLLASTIFKCHCDDKSTYPAILTHSCHNYNFFNAEGKSKGKPEAGYANSPRPVGAVDVKPTTVDEEAIVEGWRDTWHSKVWVGFHSKCKFDEDAHELMLEMLDTLGMPRSTTSAEMQDLQPYIVVLDPKGRKGMRWEKALYNCKHHKKDDPKHKCFAKLEDPAHLAKAQALEASRQRSPNPSCFHCANNVVHMMYQWEAGCDDSIASHLKEHCGIEHPEGPEALKAYSDGFRLYQKEAWWIAEEEDIVL
ncbi:hypothetical protein DFP72DRAFT_85972 [Ephemerocybe angulata]|uniref:F-box domain-containing protein n=1 Tax=Ephemerocybe angulata TaxID=980116 RepID=A0A8H6LXF6_9AGAR|nr:hypothetical protein DFP72DRAFT_85972 [Tulosesus angulatus]